MDKNTVSLIGGHFTSAGVQKDWPARIILSCNGNGLGEQHPDTIVVFRDTTIYNGEKPDDLYRNPNGKTMAFAEYWYNQLKPIFDANPADYYCITNEASGKDNVHEIETLIAYERNFCELAAADGLKCVIGKIAANSPDWDYWVQYYAPFIIEMSQKYGAICGRNVYGNGDLIAKDGTISKEYPAYPYRLVDEIEHLRSQGWNGGLFVGECGLDWGYGTADWGRFYFQITKLEQALRKYADNFIGFCWWDALADGWKARYSDYLKEMTPYMEQNALPKWEPATAVEPLPSELPKIVIVKKPQKAHMTEAENNTVSLWAWQNYGRTTTHSPDDMLQMLRGGNDESYAVVWWPQRQPGVIEALEAGGFEYITVNNTEPDNSYILPVPHLTQRDNNITNDCGAACVAMVARLADRYPIVSDVAIAYQNPPGSNMYFSQLDAALNGYGMDGNHQRPFYTGAIESAIRDNNPVIALVHYPSLPHRLTTFQGGHFIVLFGVDDDSFLYHDPLAVDEKDGLWIGSAELTRAMADATLDGNQPQQGMICSVKDEPPPIGETVDVLSYQQAHPAAWRVVYNGSHGEDVQDMSLPGGAWVRRKGNNAEWWQQDEDYAFLVHDTSPEDINGRSVCYTVYKDGLAGYSPKNPDKMTVGQTWQETGSHFVQFKYKDGCGLVTEPPTGSNRNACTLLWRNKAYKFPKLPVTLDVIALHTTNGEIQLYAKTNLESAAHYNVPEGLPVGWVGWDAAWGEANIEELYFNRGEMTQEPDRYCDWEK